ncbi:hypothetical protein RRG08_034499 [Elysia crispata]|uniref:Uncharacterized protein n=1 Tax=Elysia crispata TaxID=231223 RepID=A0AAE1ECY2_9GAST|nr:hypothetical protein RRG08_034499 [Elysia crispata]
MRACLPQRLQWAEIESRHGHQEEDSFTGRVALEPSARGVKTGSPALDRRAVTLPVWHSRPGKMAVYTNPAKRLNLQAQQCMPDDLYNSPSRSQVSRLTRESNRRSYTAKRIINWGSLPK